MRSNVRRICTPAKLLERLVWLPPVQNGLPVAFRARTDVAHPVIKINRFKITVILPIEFARFIPTLARFIRLWRNRNGNGNLTQRLPKRATFNDIVALTANTQMQRGKVEAMDELQSQHKDDSANGDGKVSPMLEVTCTCGRTIFIPPEWVVVARCSACGRFIAKVIENERGDFNAR